jgi:hypothetical protein
MGEHGDCAISYWPSNLYGVLATQAARSAQTWAICSRAIDASLGATGRHYRSWSPACLARVFRESGHSLDAREVAALLWALLRQHEQAGARIAGRLGAEFEMLAIQRPSEVPGKPEQTADVPRTSPQGFGNVLARCRSAMGSSRH